VEGEFLGCSGCYAQSSPSNQDYCHSARWRLHSLLEIAQENGIWAGLDCSPLHVVQLVAVPLRFRDLVGDEEPAASPLGATVVR